VSPNGSAADDWPPPDEPPGEPHNGKAKNGRKLSITWGKDITPEPVTWAWVENGHERLPAGSFCLVGGREGTGKSSFLIWMAAQITRGTLPGSFCGTPRVVLIIATEDSWKFTLAPRLIAAGADMGMIGRVDAQEITTEGDKNVTLTLPVDNTELERLITEHNVAMVGIDPVMSALGDHINPNANREVRSALDPLTAIAERTGAILAGIVHFRKGGGTDIAELITGSGAFKDIARATLTFMKADDGERVMTQVKNSLGRDDHPSLAYRMEQVTVPTPKGPAPTVKFMFAGVSERSVRDLLQEAQDHGASKAPGGTRNPAGQWVVQYLQQVGGTALVTDVEHIGAKVGFTKNQLSNGRRTAKTPRVESVKSDMDGGWRWVLDPMPDPAKV
jgi:hypothetical protein